MKKKALPLMEDQISNEEDSSLQAVEQSERYQLYMEKFQNLGADCQRLLRLFFMGKNMKEIAQHMGYGSVGYAKKRKFQCKEKVIKLVKADRRFEELSN